MLKCQQLIYEHGKCSVKISERGSNREYTDIHGRRQPNQEAREH